MADAEVFIQYKGTDICMDVYCPCGTPLHYDGYFAYAVRCECGALYELQQTIMAKRVETSEFTPIQLKGMDG